MEWINSTGAIAGSISAIIGLIMLLLIKPLKALKQRKNIEEQNAERFRKTVLEKLEYIMDDVADLQYERLSQAHDFYTERGWCPTSKKNQLCIMYKSYTNKGRNHLSAQYEQEILSLPDNPNIKEM